MNNESNEGPGWSPDGGRFWRKDGKLYWEDGDITEDGGIMREMPDLRPKSEWKEGENYSLWSDEKRAEVKAAKKAERDLYEKERADEFAKYKALCLSAKSKITREEYEAIQWSDYRGQDPIFMWEELP